MDSKIITTFEEFKSLSEDWQRIEQLSSTTTYFSTFYYNYTWWSVYQKHADLRLFLIIVYNNKKVVGIAPLKISRYKRRFYSCNVLEFLTEGDYADLLIDISENIDSRKIIDEVFAVITKNNDLWDEINLTHISQYSLFSHYLFKSKYNLNLNYLIEVPFINFSKFTSFENYTKFFLPKKIKQYLNRLRREVNFEMKVTNENVVEQLSKIHIAEKKYLLSKGLIQRHSLFEDVYRGDFLNTLYTNNDNVLTYMLVDSKNSNVICYYTGYVYNNVFHSFNTAYNPIYQKLAVGKIFNYLIFENNQIEKRWDVFDMGTGRYAWKFEWTDTFNLLYQYKVFQPNDKKIHYLNKCEKLISAILQFIKK